jgi:hypothetical protein
MLRSNFQILLEKMKNEELSPEIMEKLSLFTDALVNRNYPGASLIQTVSTILRCTEKYYGNCLIGSYKHSMESAQGMVERPEDSYSISE